MSLLLTFCQYFLFFFSLLFLPIYFLFFFFNDTATTEIYTLSLHDALPISSAALPCRDRRLSRRSPPRGPNHSCAALHARSRWPAPFAPGRRPLRDHVRMALANADRKSTRLNSSHDQISYAVFCLKKKRVQIDLNAFGLVGLGHDFDVWKFTADDENRIARFNCFLLWTRPEHPYDACCVGTIIGHTCFA